MNNKGLLKTILSWRALSFLITLAAVESLRLALFVVLLPVYLPAELQFETWQVGLVISCQFGADLALKAWMGNLADRFGAWRVLLPGFVLAVAAIWVLPSVQTFFGMALCALVFGAGFAGAWPAVVSGISRLLPEDQQGQALSIVFIAWLGGGGVGPVLASLVSSDYLLSALRIARIVAVVPLVVGVIGFLQVWFGVFSVEGTRRSQPPLLTQLWHNIQKLWPLLPGMFVQTLALGVLTPVLVPFAQQRLGVGNLGFTFVLLVGGGAAVLTLWPAGLVADRFGARRSLVFGLFLAAGTLTWVIQLHDMKYVLVLIGLLGLSYGIVLPAWNSVLATAVPRHQRGGMMGFFMTVEALGMTVGPAFGGLLVSFGQVMSLAFYVAAGLLALMGVLYLFLRIDLIRVEEAAT